MRRAGLPVDRGAVKHKLDELVAAAREGDSEPLSLP